MFQGSMALLLMTMQVWAEGSLFVDRQSWKDGGCENIFLFCETRKPVEKISWEWSVGDKNTSDFVFSLPGSSSFINSTSFCDTVLSYGIYISGSPTGLKLGIWHLNYISASCSPLHIRCELSFFDTPPVRTRTLTFRTQVHAPCPVAGINQQALLVGNLANQSAPLTAETMTDIALSWQMPVCQEPDQWIWVQVNDEDIPGWNATDMNYNTSLVYSTTGDAGFNNYHFVITALNPAGAADSSEIRICVPEHYDLPPPVKITDENITYYTQFWPLLPFARDYTISIANEEGVEEILTPENLTSVSEMEFFIDGQHLKDDDAFTLYMEYVLDDNDLCSRIRSLVPVTTQEVTTRAETTEEITTEKAATQKITTQKAATQRITTQKAATQAITRKIKQLPIASTSKSTAHNRVAEIAPESLVMAVPMAIMLITRFHQ